MRYFTLVNNAGKTLDITSRSIFFYAVDGLGFEEDDTFQAIGEFWMLSNSTFKQKTISGTMLFNKGDTEDLANDPYFKYQEFAAFIADTPLTLNYYPFGFTDDEKSTFHRRVRVSKLGKSEKNEFGVLECDIEFVTYSPWYQIVTYSMSKGEEPSNRHKWIWDTPLVFEPLESQESDGAIPAWFDWEPEQDFVIQLDGLQVNAPTKITIYGPCSNPFWSHAIFTENGSRPISAGRFSSNVELDVGDRLVIDNTFGQYKITRITQTGATEDVYSKRDFGTDCFVSLRNGKNAIYVGSSSEAPITDITAEVQILYAAI